MRGLHRLVGATALCALALDQLGRGGRLAAADPHQGRRFRPERAAARDLLPVPEALRRGRRTRQDPLLDQPDRRPLGLARGPAHRRSGNRLPETLGAPLPGSAFPADQGRVVPLGGALRRRHRRRLRLLLDQPDRLGRRLAGRGHRRQRPRHPPAGRLLPDRVVVRGRVGRTLYGRKGPDLDRPDRRRRGLDRRPARRIARPARGLVRDADPLRRRRAARPAAGLDQPDRRRLGLDGARDPRRARGPAGRLLRRDRALRRRQRGGQPADLHQPHRRLQLARDERRRLRPGDRRQLPADADSASRSTTTATSSPRPTRRAGAAPGR